MSIETRFRARDCLANHAPRVFIPPTVSTSFDSITPGKNTCHVDATAIHDPAGIMLLSTAWEADAHCARPRSGCDIGLHFVHPSPFDPRGVGVPWAPLFQNHP